MSPLRGNSSSAGTSRASSAATMALRSGTGAWCALMSSATLPVAATAARAASSSSTLIPMPTTTCTGPPASARISMRMPPSLPRAVTRSLGHLRRTPLTPSSFSASTAARPTTRLSAERSAGMSGYCQASDRQMAPPGGAIQPRPRRPRPPVWCSASTTAAMPAARRQRLEQARVGGLERPFDLQRLDARAHARRQAAPRCAPAPARSRPGASR